MAISHSQLARGRLDDEGSMSDPLNEHEQAAVERVAAVYDKAAKVCTRNNHLATETWLTIAANMLQAADAAQPPASDDEQGDLEVDDFEPQVADFRALKDEMRGRQPGAADVA